MKHFEHSYIDIRFSENFILDDFSNEIISNLTANIENRL